MKSERLKKLEGELKDLEKWLELDLVPKKDLEKHRKEVDLLKDRIDEEKRRIQMTKDTGDSDEYAIPKRGQNKQMYEHQSLPGIDDEGEEGSLEMESTYYENDHTTLFDIEMGGEEKTQTTQELSPDEEDPYSDKNRWKRSTEIVDPESDDW
ncbi:MAG: hypothetical protein A3F09_00220 [Chlamydiae bacterium RIFCSPHIGHO2_12_FULL_49_11]|nr:MAG: hypothetical protein A3F09_00220 [Chlamydiae bacterium RIFCSPHIGHO2_12_FULL_49_11]